MNIERKYSYSDIYMVPGRTIVPSRKDCDTSIILGSHTFDMPVYPSNMRSVVNQDTCLYFAQRGWFYTMHRFGIDQVEFMRFMIKNKYFTSISLGVNESSYKEVSDMVSAGLYPDYITIDVANGYSLKCEMMTKHVKKVFPKSFLIVGNVATKEGALELASWGVDGIKAGIANGSVCITRQKTGFYFPIASCVDEVSVSLNKNGFGHIAIIADGGIVDHGDIGESVALGSTMIMTGGLFSGYDESAGDIIEVDGRVYKEYYGSASEFNKGAYRNVEGKKKLVEYRGPIEKLLIELKEDLQSGIAYSGGKTLKSLRNNKMITDK